MKTSSQKPPLKHSIYLNKVKELLKADFVGWITEGDKKVLRVKVKNKEHFLPLEGDVINQETYMHLIRNLIKP